MLLPKINLAGEWDVRREAFAWRQQHGQTDSDRRRVARDRAVYSGTAAASFSISRPQADRQSSSDDGHSLRAPDRHWLGGPSAGNGLRLRNDVLAALARLDCGRRVGHDPSRLVGSPERRRPDRLVTGPHRQQQRSRCFWGAKTGPNPTDRRKAGTKHHLITDGGGIPLAASITGANRHDVTQLIPLVDAIPPIYGKPGRPRHRPDAVYADRAYDSQPHRRALRARGIRPCLARRRAPHGSGLGRDRWPVERTHSWLHQCRRLRVRYDKRDDIHDAFLKLGCIRICLKKLKTSFC